MGNSENGHVIVKGGGFRAGGKIYRDGDKAPARYARMLEPTDRPNDPAGGMIDAPPNYGRSVMPHVFTFRGIQTTLSKAYRFSDEALRDSVENANMMINDPVVMQAVFARQRMTALLNYHVESEDDGDPELKAVADELMKIISYTPRFLEYRRNLLDAIFYGRHAIQQQFGFKINREGKRRVKIAKWNPIHGDKLVFRYDDGLGTYDPDQFGVRVTGAMSTEDAIAGRRDLEPTGTGLAYFFQPWERKHVALHKHMIMDAPFEDPLGGAKIHGVGIRSFIYWLWYQKQETLAQLVEIVERTGMGVQVYRYPEGNNEARLEMEKVAQELAHTNVLLFPTTPNDDYQVDIVPPNTAGIDALHELLERYFHDAIVKFILGQTLSTSAQATGLGSGVADLHEESMMQVAHYDAINLEETLTTETLNVLRDMNFPKYRNVDFFLKIDTKTPKTSELMAAAKDLFEMGAKLRESDLFDIVGLSMPKEADRFLQNPEIGPAVDQLNGDSMGAAAPPGLPAAPNDGQPQAGPLPGPPAPGAVASDAPGAGPDLPDDDGGEPGDLGPDEPPADPQSRQDEETRKLFGPLLHRKATAYAKGLRSRIEAAAAETDLDPSPEAIEAGNYKMGRCNIHGLAVTIENPKGSTRRAVDGSWEREMNAHYGYVRGTLGRDGDHVDVFIGPQPESEVVFVVDQVTDGGRFDEHKALLGYTSEAKARTAYLSHYPKGWRMGPITAMTVEQFKAWLEHGDQSQRVAEQVSRYGKDWKESEWIREKGKFAGRSGGKEEPKSASKPAGPVGAGFVSTHKGSEKITLDEAFERLKSPEFQEKKRQFADIDKEEGLEGVQADVIGDWGDTPEPTIFTLYYGGQDWNKIQLATARKGKAADQLFTLAFKEEEGGPDAIWAIEVPLSIKEARASLTKHGVKERSIAKRGDRVYIAVFDEKGKYRDGLNAFVEEHNVTQKQIIRGRGEYHGAYTHEEAQRAYDERIRSLEGSSVSRGHHGEPGEDSGSVRGPESYHRLARLTPLFYKNWDESKHPRAPSGGAKLGGKDYKPGEFIPTEALQSASPRELADLSRAIDTDKASAPKSEPKNIKQRAKEGIQRAKDPNAPKPPRGWETGLEPASEGRDEPAPKPVQEWPKEEEVPREEQGQPQQPAPKKSSQPQVDALNALPDGAVIDGWKAEKSTPEFGDVRLWTKGDKALTSVMMAEFYPEESAAAVTQAQQGQGTPASQPGPTPQQPPQSPPVDNKRHADNLRKVSSLFGIAPGDSKNEKRAGAFALKTARALGLDPRGKTREEQVRHATDFLARSHAPLSSLVGDAESLGFKSKATNLVTRSRNAAKWVTDQAEQAGYKVQGKSDFERFRGALGYLQGMAAKRDSQTPPPVPDAPPVQGQPKGIAALAQKVSDWAGTSVWKWAVVAFAGYAVLSLARGSSRRRRFFGKQNETDEPDSYVAYAEDAEPELTAEDLGYQEQSPVDGDQCGNCRYFADGSCTLYRWLNQKYPEHANFWGVVDPAAWCEAHTGENDHPNDGKRYALTLIHKATREVPA